MDAIAAIDGPARRDPRRRAVDHVPGRGRSARRARSSGRSRCATTAPPAPIATCSTRRVYRDASRRAVLSPARLHPRRDSAGRDAHVRGQRRGGGRPVHRGPASSSSSPRDSKPLPSWIAAAGHLSRCRLARTRAGSRRACRCPRTRPRSSTSTSTPPAACARTTGRAPPARSAASELGQERASKRTGWPWRPVASRAHDRRARSLPRRRTTARTVAHGDERLVHRADEDRARLPRGERGDRRVQRRQLAARRIRVERRVRSAAALRRRRPRPSRPFRPARPPPTTSEHPAAGKVRASRSRNEPPPGMASSALSRPIRDEKPAARMIARITAGIALRSRPPPMWRPVRAHPCAQRRHRRSSTPRVLESTAWPLSM